MNGIGEKRHSNTRDGISFGYIILPDNHQGEDNRKIYIDNCYRQNRVAILPENGGTPIFDCVITQSAIKEIVFPTETNKLGSGICFMTISNGMPIVLDVVSKMDETSFITENSWQIIREDSEGVVLLKMDAKNGLISLQNISYTNKPATVIINIKDPSKQSAFNLNVSGAISIDLSGIFGISSLDSVVMKVNETSEISIKEKIKIQNENESIKVLLEDILTAITQLTVTTGVGASGVPINASDFQSIKTRIGDLFED